MHSLLYPCQFYVKVTFFLFPSTYNFSLGTIQSSLALTFPLLASCFLSCGFLILLFTAQTIIWCGGTHASHLYGNQDVGSTKMVLLESPLEQKN